MNINDVTKMMKEKTGSYIYDIYVPSLKKKVGFKPLTVSDHKTLTKIYVSDPDNYKIALMALIPELSNNAIDISDVNYYDEQVIITHIVHNSGIYDDNIMKAECVECGSKFNYKIPFTKLIEKIEKFDFTPLEFVTETPIAKYDCVIKPPSLRKILDFKNGMDVLREEFVKTNPSEDVETVELTFDTIYDDFITLLYIESLSFDGNPIEGLDDIGSLFEFYNALEPAFQYRLKEFVMEKFIEPLEIYHTVKCPKCKFEHKNEYNAINFI